MFRRRESAGFVVQDQARAVQFRIAGVDHDDRDAAVPERQELLQVRIAFRAFRRLDDQTADSPVHHHLKTALFPLLVVVGARQVQPHAMGAQHRFRSPHNVREDVVRDIRRHHADGGLGRPGLDEVRRRHERSLAALAIQIAFLLQFVQRLANGLPAHAEPGSQFILRRQQLVRLPFAAVQPGQNLLLQLQIFRQIAARHSVDTALPPFTTCAASTPDRRARAPDAARPGAYPCR